MEGPDRLGGPIRVLHVVSTFAVKTDTKWLYQLLSRLSRERVEPAIGCIYGGGPMMPRFADLPVPTFNLNAPRELSAGAVARAYRLIRRLKPHIVHTHLLRADLYGALAARLAKVPTVLSSVYALGPYRRDRVRRSDVLLDRACRRLATHALAVSQAVRADLIERRGWAADRVTVIHTGIAFPDAPADLGLRRRIREQWQIADSSPLVLTVARLSYEKGIETLIDAAAIVHRRVPAARFAVVGDGPLRGDLQAKITSAGLSDVIRLAGFRPDVDAVLAAGDLFVLPSHMEGMPNALLEAYAAGLPVVATAAGGMVEAVEQGRSGILVPPGRAEELASAIALVLQDDALRRRLAGDGRDWARQRFSLERAVHEYETLYERLCRPRCGNEGACAPRSVMRDPVAEI